MASRSASCAAYVKPGGPGGAARSPRLPKCRLLQPRRLPSFRPSLFAQEFRSMFKGSIVALITPMHADGSVDEDAYARFIEWQIEQGTEGIVPVGTTGESPTLSHAEHRRAVEIAVRTAAKRVPVIAGAGSNSTAEAV